MGLARPATESGGAQPRVAAPDPGTDSVAVLTAAVLAGDQPAAATVLRGRGGGGVALQEPGRGVESIVILAGLDVDAGAGCRGNKQVQVQAQVQVQYKCTSCQGGQVGRTAGC